MSEIYIFFQEDESKMYNYTGSFLLSIWEIFSHFPNYEMLVIKRLYIFVFQILLSPGMVWYLNHVSAPSLGF